jgi:hypothetical protein
VFTEGLNDLRTKRTQEATPREVISYSYKVPNF